MIDEDAGDRADQTAFLSEAEALEDGLRLGGAGIWRWKTGSDQLWWTRNLEQVHHLPPGSFDGSLSSFQRDLHPDDAEGIWRKIRESIETGAPYRAVYRTAPRAQQGELCRLIVRVPNKSGTRTCIGRSYLYNRRIEGEITLPTPAQSLFACLAL